MLNRVRHTDNYYNNSQIYDDTDDDGIYQINTTDKVNTINFSKPITIQGHPVLSGDLTDRVEQNEIDISNIDVSLASLASLVEANTEDISI